MNSVVRPAPAVASSRFSIRTLRAILSREWIACAALCALWFGATAWLRPLAIPDEGRYAGVSWEMLRSGDLLVPTLNGHPFFHKPPLFYWITAASMDVFGVSAWAARVASLLAASAAATALFEFVRRHAGVRRARATVLVLATLPLFYGGAQYANLDMLVAACIAVTILLFAHAALAEAAQRPHRLALGLAFAAAAGGVLAKGLIGAVIPALVVLVWGAAVGRMRPTLRLLCWAPGALIFAALAAPWFIAMQQRYPDFGHYFFVVQHLQRFASGGFNNPQPLWFYPAVLGATTLPWSPWALAFASKAYWQQREHAELRKLMLVWLAVVTLFFSAPASKLVGYILPAIPPLAFLMADAIAFFARARRASARSGRSLHRATLVLAASGCVAIAIAAHFYQPKSLADLAVRLQARRLPDEGVVFLGHYHYDLPFYARLEAPVLVADPWAPAELAKDNWRSELADAERFSAPGPARHLLQVDELAGLLCGPRASWLVGPWPATAATAWLAAQEPVYRQGDTALWHVAPQAGPACATR